MSVGAPVGEAVVDTAVDPDRSARVLTGKADESVRSPQVELRQGVITAVDVPGARVDVNLGGDTTTIPGVAHLSNYRAKVNDTCWVLVNGPDLLVMDRAGGTGPSVISDAVAANISTDESRSSDTFGDLSTVGPSVSVSVSPSGRLLVQVSAFIECGEADGGIMSAQLSGANSSSPSVANALIVYIARANTAGGASKVILYTGLAAGTTTVTAKYRAAIGNSEGRFSDRQVWAVPL